MWLKWILSVVCTIDKYSKEYVLQIKQAQNDENLEQSINKIYEDGFQDGVNSERE